MTCGPAAIYMIECLVRNKLIEGGEGRISLISSRFGGSLFLSNLLGGSGTTVNNLLEVIRYLGLHVRLQELGGALKTNLLQSRMPALVLFGAYKDEERVGGHWVVASRVSKRGRVVFLDPMDGKVHELQNNGYYNAMQDNSVYYGCLSCDLKYPVDWVAYIC